MSAALFELPGQSDDEVLPSRGELAREAVRRLGIAVEHIDEFSVADQVRMVHQLSLTLAKLKDMYERRPAKRT